jgi:hypothetical protein
MKARNVRRRNRVGMSYPEISKPGQNQPEPQPYCMKMHGK